MGSSIFLPMLEFQGNLCITKPNVPCLTFSCEQFMKNYGDSANNWKKLILHRPADRASQAPSTTMYFLTTGETSPLRADAATPNSTFMQHRGSGQCFANTQSCNASKQGWHRDSHLPGPQRHNLHRKREAAACIKLKLCTENPFKASHPNGSHCIWGAGLSVIADAVLWESWTGRSLCPGGCLARRYTSTAARAVALEHTQPGGLPPPLPADALHGDTRMKSLQVTWFSFPFSAIG